METDKRLFDVVRIDLFVKPQILLMGEFSL